MLSIPPNTIKCADVLEGLAALPAARAQLVITSPPYNLDINYKNHKDDLSEAQYYGWLDEVWRECLRILEPGGRICINMGENKRGELQCPPHVRFAEQLVAAGALYRGMFIWNKHNAASKTAWGSWRSAANPHIVPTHEYIIVFSKTQYKLEARARKNDISAGEFITCKDSIWNFGPESKKRLEHPAPFPVQLPARLIRFYSYCGDMIIDPFAGSGTVGVAAKLLGRNYYLIDNSEKYCAAAAARLAELKAPAAEQIIIPNDKNKVIRDGKLCPHRRPDQTRQNLSRALYSVIENRSPALVAALLAAGARPSLADKHYEQKLLLAILGGAPPEVLTLLWPYYEKEPPEFWAHVAAQVAATAQKLPAPLQADLAARTAASRA